MSCLAGTFARVWLVRLMNAKKGDEDKVFALKILRKTDGNLISCLLFMPINYLADPMPSSDTAQASRACPKRTERLGRRRWSPLHYYPSGELSRLRLSIYAGMLAFLPANHFSNKI